MVEGLKGLKKDQNPRSSLLEGIIIVISVFTVIAVLVIILGYFSPPLPIPEVSCANSVNNISSQTKGDNAVYYNNYLYIPYTRSVNNTVNNHPNNKKDCYRISDVLSLNKAVHITDAISLVTLLLTFFGITVPLISYLNFQKEKKTIVKKLALQDANFDKRFNLYGDNTLKEIEKYKEKLIGSMKEETNNYFPVFAKIMGNIESFKTEYLYTLKSNNVSDQQAISDATGITTNLYRLLSEKEERVVKGLLANIESLFRPGLLDQKKYYRTYAFLKSIFRIMYEINIFDTREKENALDAFSQRVFKMPLRTLLMYEDPIKP